MKYTMYNIFNEELKIKTSIKGGIEILMFTHIYSLQSDIEHLVIQANFWFEA